MTQLQNPYMLPALLQMLRQQQGYQEAKRANEQRRDDIIKGRTDTRNRVLDQWKGYGDSLTADTNEQFDKALNDSRAHLSQLGMLGSTNVEALNTQNAKERLNAMRRVKDDITSNFANTDERLSNNIDDFKERIVDEYPNNTNSMAQIAALLGNLAGSYGGGAMPGNPLAYQQPQISLGLSAQQQPTSGVGRVLPPRPPAPTMAEKIAKINADMMADSAGAVEQKRRGAMINLTQSMQPGWPNIVKEQQALANLVNNGWAEQNPVATTNTLVDTSGQLGQRPIYNPSVYPGGGSSYPRRQYLGAAQQRSTRAGMERLAAARQRANTNTDEWLASVGATPAGTGPYVNPMTNPVAGAMSMLPINASSFGTRYTNSGGGSQTAATSPYTPQQQPDPNSAYNLSQILPVLRAFGMVF